MDEEVLTGEVCRAFALGAPVGPMVQAARGEMGQIWRLETERGVFAAKQLFPWAREDRLAFEAVITDAAIAADLPTPAMIRAPGGEIILRLGDVRWRVFTWMDLGAPLSPPPTDAMARQVGRLLARLHGLRLEGRSEEVIPWFTQRRRASHWRILAARARAADAHVADLVDGALETLIELARTALPADSLGSCVLSHCDLGPGNAPPHGAGLAVLDWEHAGPIPPAWELGYVLHAWCLTPDGAVHTDAARAIVEGYVEAGGARPDPGLDIFAGAISGTLNWMGVRIFAAIAPEDTPDRSRAREDLRGLLTQPVSRARLETLLAAL